MFDDWSFLKLLAEGQGLIGCTTLLSECVTISDQGYTLRVIHVRWERDQDLVLVCRRTSASWVLLGSSR